MFQKIVFSTLIVMLSTAAFAVEGVKEDAGREGRADEAKAVVDAQNQADHQNQIEAKAYNEIIAGDQDSSQSQGGQTAAKVLRDAKLSILPGVQQFAKDMGSFRNVKIKDPVTGQERAMPPDEARIAALGKVRTGLTDEEFNKACGE